MTTTYYFDVDISDFDPADIERVKEAAGVAIGVSYYEDISPGDSSGTLSLSFEDEAPSRYMDDPESLGSAMSDDIADTIEDHTGHRPAVEVTISWLAQ